VEGIYQLVKDAIEGGKPAVLATVIQGPFLGKHIFVREDGTASGSISDQIDEQVVRAALEQLRKGKSDKRALQTRDGEVLVFLDVYAPPQLLIVVGATHIGIALARLAKDAGFKVIVVDPRERFATRERFPMADEVYPAWPQEVLPKLRNDSSTYVVVMTHDPKIDDPAILTALSGNAIYVGAIGSRKVSAERLQRFRAMGVPEDQLTRLRAPIGLDLGADSPEELAIAILAEMIAARTGGTCLPLSQSPVKTKV
jgi:xanthine dehydrogenase accessory factor